MMGKAHDAGKLRYTTHDKKMAFTIRDEDGGIPAKKEYVPGKHSRTAAWDAALGGNALFLYMDLVSHLQLSDGSPVRSLVSTVCYRDWEQSALSRAFTELRRKGFITLVGGDTLKTADSIRVQTFGELPK